MFKNSLTQKSENKSSTVTSELGYMSMFLQIYLCNIY